MRFYDERSYFFEEINFENVSDKKLLQIAALAASGEVNALKQLSASTCRTMGGHIPWKQIEHLCVMPVNYRYEHIVPAGTYVNKSGNLLIIILERNDGIQQYLNRMGSKLSTVSIYRIDIKGIYFGQLTHLTHISVNGCTNVAELPGIEKLVHLSSLDLSGCVDLVSLAGLDKLGLLSDLSLAGCKGITILPDVIRHLKALRRLNLSNLELKELPNWLPEIAESFSINEHIQNKGKQKAHISFFGTTVKDIDMSIFERPYEIVVQWFQNRSNVPLNEIKVIFLGDGDAGKTHTIARLLNNGDSPINFNGQATPGIAISNHTYDLGNKHVQVHFWDFGGQEILHSMHRMFLTKRTLYVVLLNARDDKQDEQARYWLHNINSFTPDAPVLLALNKVDQNPNASINESGLRNCFPSLTEVVHMSALEDSKDKFNSNFTAALMRQIAAFKHLDTPFTPEWHKLKEKIYNMKAPYIDAKEFNVFCRECGIKEDDNTKRSILEWFSDLGVSYCYYNGISMVEDYVVLRPEWITNAIYILLYNKIESNRNGMISRKDIFRMLKRPDVLPDTIHRVLPEVYYSAHEIEYVLDVVHQFRLSYPVTLDMEFFPMLCNRNETDIVRRYSSYSDVMEFRIVYEYLPNNVLHRLMVDRYFELHTDDVWLSGARFIQVHSGVSAVVKSDGNILIIYVRGGTEDSAKTYLESILYATQRITKELGLKISERQIRYCEGSRSAIFDYDDVIGSKEAGMSCIFSKQMKKAIPISDILKQSGPQASEDRENLIKEVLNTCRRMQTNRIYWKASEDDRNTYIRDALEDRGYTAKDQTLVGVGAGGKRAGELDIEIRKVPNAPWTIFEGLNLRGTSPSEIEKWDKHLTKLLTNYNPIGLSFLIMASYVPCKENKFVSISNEFAEHMKLFNPCPYKIEEVVEESTNSEQSDATNFLRMMRCIYNCGGAITTVYHIFLRLGDDTP